MNARRWLATALRVVALFACAVPSVHAHKSSDAYLWLRSGQGARPALQLDVALRDLDAVLGLDADGDGQLRWGEVRARQRDIAGYALARLHFERAGSACEISEPALLLDAHSDGAYAVLRAEVRCAGGLWPQRIDYRLFANVDAGHRGLLSLDRGNTSTTVVLGGSAPQSSLDAAAGDSWRALVSFGVTGVRHVLHGLDHLLFLLSLLLPAVLLRVGRQWLPQPALRPAFVEVCKVVTAFTVAHSVTLSLATLGVLHLPARLTESAIALSVALAALNNLTAWLRSRVWLAAFGFGLIHGFGFASALQDLGLGGGATALALVGFNLGVEAGPLAVVALFLPLAYWLRHTQFYRRLVFTNASAAIALLGALWMVERLSGRLFLPVH